MLYTTNTYNFHICQFKHINDFGKKESNGKDLTDDFWLWRWERLWVMEGGQLLNAGNSQESHFRERLQKYSLAGTLVVFQGTYLAFWLLTVRWWSCCRNSTHGNLKKKSHQGFWTLHSQVYKLEFWDPKLQSLLTVRSTQATWIRGVGLSLLVYARLTCQPAHSWVATGQWKEPVDSIAQYGLKDQCPDIGDIIYACTIQGHRAPLWLLFLMSQNSSLHQTRIVSSYFEAMFIIFSGHKEYLYAHYLTLPESLASVYLCPLSPHSLLPLHTPRPVSQKKDHFFQPHPSWKWHLSAHTASTQLKWPV